jgi:phosphohistidine phosphatase
VKHLLLLRHAEARPATPGTGDRERPLSAEGRLQAERVGEHLARRGLEPGLVLCSPARRAQETLAGVRRHLPEATRVRIDAELYLANPHQLLARIEDMEEGVRCVLLVGHNPGIGELAFTLAEQGPPAALAAMRKRFPAAALAEIELDEIPWPEVSAGGGRLVSFTTPRDLV